MCIIIKSLLAHLEAKAGASKKSLPNHDGTRPGSKGPRAGLAPVRELRNVSSRLAAAPCGGSKAAVLVRCSPRSAFLLNRASSEHYPGDHQREQCPAQGTLTADYRRAGGTTVAAQAGAGNQRRRLHPGGPPDSVVKQGTRGHRDHRLLAAAGRRSDEDRHAAWDNLLERPSCVVAAPR
jgi:hypothetical protein